MHKYVQQLKSRPETAKLGSKWTDEEKEHLLQSVRQGVPLNEIAAQHKRTVGSVTSKLTAIAIERMRAGTSLHDAAAGVGMDVRVVAAAHEKSEKRKKVGRANPFSAFAFRDDMDEDEVDDVQQVQVAQRQVQVAQRQAPVPDPQQQLNDEQQQALETVQSGASIFLTGPAGSGKSHALRAIIEWARSNREVGVTASTGSAGVLVGGRTLHSFLGIGLGKKSAQELAQMTRWRARKKLLDRLLALDILVIDEVSMINAELLDLISDYLKLVRHRLFEPFGGVQIVLCGDFCQLPPVEGKFCFLAKVWQEMQLRVVALTCNVRQSKDPEFQGILERARWGKCTTEDIARLRATSTNALAGPVRPTKLFATNRDIDAINKAELDKLLEQGAAHSTYRCSLSAANADKSKDWAASSNVPDAVVIAERAQVVLTCNLPAKSPGEERRVNGQRGVAVALQSDGVWVQWIDGTRSFVSASHRIDCEDDPDVYVRYLPLRLAWAISIHKSQGMTLDALEMDLGDTIFETGQAYTALSRARSLDLVRISRVDDKAFRTHAAVRQFYGVM